MNFAKQSKVEAINNRKSHNNRCDLRKYNIEGDKKRCTNCTNFYPFDELNKVGRCKPCWNLEFKHRREGTLNEYKEEIKSRWNVINKEYLNQALKKCNTCLDVKSFDEFYNEKAAYDGKQNKCIKCTALYNKGYSPYKKEYNKKQHRKYYNHQRKNNIQFKLSLNLRNRLKSQIQSYNKNNLFIPKKSALPLIGIPLEEFVSYIENQFVKGYMNWENWGVVWELDHIKPISSFDLTKENELKKCFNYKNYQPLFKLTTTIEGVEHLGNRNKSNKII